MLGYLTGRIWPFIDELTIVPPVHILKNSGEIFPAKEINTVAGGF
jgi:hypothetical protein